MHAPQAATHFVPTSSKRRFLCRYLPISDVVANNRPSISKATPIFQSRLSQLALWSEGGSVVDHSSATQIKVERNKAYSRRGVQAWQEIPDFTGAFAPDGDFLAYLSAARNIVKQGSESRASIEFTRYTFELDGLRFATFVRSQLEKRMASQGKLPAGMQIELPAQYRDMVGQGELWVRSDGSAAAPDHQSDVPRAKRPPR